jgi:SSS family solute:Na+ symporter
VAAFAIFTIFPPYILDFSYSFLSYIFHFYPFEKSVSMANPLVLAGLGFYLVLRLGIGLYASRRIKGSADFIVAGKRLSLLLCTATLAATWFGGGICIGAASAAYKGGLLAVVADPFGAALCLFLAGLFYVRLMRRMGLMTIASFFTSRFGPKAGLLASLCTIPAYVGWVGSLLVAFGRILQTLTGIEPATGICIATAIVLVYTWAGGMWAVTLTDVVQVVVLILGLFILTPILISDMGGWAAIVAQIPSSRFDFYPQEGTSASWLSYARDWLVIGLGNLAGQDLIQRSLSSRDEKIAYRSAYLAGLLYITVGLLPIFLGMAGAVVLPGLADPDLIMMSLAMKYLPDLALVLFMGALLSALLSSADSALLAPASVLGWDLLHYFKPDASEQLSLRTTRLSVLLLGIFSLAIALQTSSVYELMVNSWSVLLASLFVPLTAGLWWRHSNDLGALASILVGLCSWQILSFAAPDMPRDLLAVPFAAIALVLVSYLSKDQSPPRPLIDAEGHQLDYTDRLGTQLFAKS